MGLLRKIIFVGGALFLLPSPPDERPQDQAQHHDLARNASYLVAASSALADMTSFCTRQPTTCSVAGELAARAELKAKYSIKLLYEWATDKDKPAADKATMAVTVLGDPMTTGSTRPTSSEQQSTLTIDDVLPPWLGPKPGKG